MSVAALLSGGYPHDTKIAEEGGFEAIGQAIALATPQELARKEQRTELRRIQPINFAEAVLHG